MKKIINNKVYDTKTAKKMGSWDNNKYGSFEYTHEVLYQKKTGEFFLYGEGGPMSRYAEPSGSNGWTSGEKIMPLTYAQAQKWAEEHLDGDEYEEIFGEIVEDESKRTLNIYIKMTTYEKLKRMASEQGISVGEIIDNLVNEK